MSTFKFVHTLLLALLTFGVINADEYEYSYEDSFENISPIPSKEPRFHYLLVLPKVLESGSTSIAHVVLHNVQQNVYVEATIRLHNSNDTLNYWTARTILGYYFPETELSIPVPDISGANMKLAAITIDLVDLEENLLFHAQSASSTKYLIIRDPGFSIFITTDKQIYKPGQEVNFRILQLRNKFPTNYKVNKVTISDPRGRKLQVYTNLMPRLGIASGQFHLINEPTYGDWKIDVECNGLSFSTVFEVEEFVLPKFEVTIQTSEYLTTNSGKFPVKVCGKYTYGKGVRGQVSASFRIPWYWSKTQRVTGETDETGCVVIEGDPSILEFERVYQGTQLSITANITEEFTGIQVSESKKFKVTTPYVLTVKNYKSSIRANFPWTALATYTSRRGTPVSNRILTAKLQLRYRNNSDVLQAKNITTDENGEATISFIGDHNALSGYIEVFDPFRVGIGSQAVPEVFISMAVVRSQSFSYIQLDQNLNGNQALHCGERMDLTGVAIVTYFTPEHAQQNVVYYTMTSGRRIVGSGSVDSMPCAENEPYYQNGILLYRRCTFNFRITTVANNNWVPAVKIMAYIVRDDGEVLTDDISIPVEDCDKNDVSLEFDSTTVHPGERVSLALSAEPRSLCALSVVDKSVYLLGGDNTLTKEKVSTEARRVSTESMEYVDHEGCHISYFRDHNRIDKDDVVISRYRRRRKRSTFHVRNDRSPMCLEGIVPTYLDAFSSFEALNLLFLTNLRIHVEDCKDIDFTNLFSCLCGTDCQDAYGAGMPGAGGSAIQVRNYFPETWRWELVDIGENGTAVFDGEIPDTITEWIASSYCVSETAGVGISEMAAVKGFKPVFLSMALPYSIVRGEEIAIKASLFSYLSPEICLEMVISLEKTNQFDVLNEEQIDTHKCICGGQSIGIQFGIRPLTLGEISFTMRTWSRDRRLCGKEVSVNPGATDGVSRTLIVEPEGIEEEITANDLICPKDGRPTTAIQGIHVPEEAYGGSAGLLVNVIGNIMGPVLDNLNHLIRVPYGCGEQNMITMVPNLVVLRFLESTRRLTPELEGRLKSNILLGYQRQLNYQRRDGSFSAFGDDDANGSTWLTAFVISTFEQSKRYVFIDDNIVVAARAFLTANTGEDGCVKKIGLVHDKGMMGGVDGKNALNAYVSLALYRPGGALEPANPGDITGCDGSANIKLYTMAIKFYTNALKGKFAAAKALWSALKENANITGGKSFETAQTAFWSDMSSQKQAAGTPNWEYYRKPSDAVEVTGYVLLGYVKMGDAFPGEFPVEQAFCIVQYLTAQRNAYGGYSSTQNTIVGLTALAAYAQQTYVDDTSLILGLRKDGADVSNIFEINQNDDLTVQQVWISPVPTEISYEVSGKGCALVQTNLRYNVPRKERDPSFTISTFVRGLEKGCTASGNRLLVICATYQGTHEQPVSNMAVFEIKLVSGYHAVKESLTKMTQANKFNGLKRHELDGKKVIIYFRAIGSQSKCAAFEVEYVEEVKNPQPGLARVYDYYDPVKEATTLYNLSCKWETYDPNTYTHDCMQWSEQGHCEKTCDVGRTVDGFCGVEIMQKAPGLDYCERWGDRECRNGVCKMTSRLYRCACDEGYKENKWGARCIREKETDVSSIVLRATNPDCVDEVCPIPAQMLENGNDTFCFCDEGFVLFGNDSKAYCEDVDECENNPCNDTTLECHNSPGSYSCSCKDGYLPFADFDEGVVDLSHCTAIEGESEVEEKQAEEAQDAVEPPTEESEITMDCPVCLPHFPRPSEYQSIFCPKANVYIVTNASLAITLRAIVLGGNAIYGPRINHVKIHMDSSCVCDNLADTKSMMTTPHCVEESSDGNSIRLDHRTFMTTKRAWKKVQNMKCENSSTKSDTGGEDDGASHRMVEPGMVGVAGES